MTTKLRDKSLAQLKEYAAELDVIGRSRMSKDELVTAILAARARNAAWEERRAAEGSRPLSARRGSTAKPRKTSTTSGTPVRGKAGGEKSPARKAPAEKPARETSPKAKTASKGKASAGKTPVKPAPKKTQAKVTTKKAAAAKTPARKVAAGPATKKVAAAKAPAKKAAAAKAPAKKTLSRKTTTQAPARKAAAQKAPAKKAPARKAPFRQSPARKTAPKKTTPARKVAVRKAPPKKASPTGGVRGGTAALLRGAVKKPEAKRKVLKRVYKLTPAAPPLNLRAGELFELAMAAAADEAAARAQEVAVAAAAPVEPVRAYLEDRLVLLARDPQWLYCYWELSEATLEAVRGKAGGDSAAMALRVKEVGRRNHRDIELPDQPAGNWYFESLGDDVEHQVEIGFRSSDGRFFRMLRSNAMRTPRQPAIPAPVEVPSTRGDPATAPAPAAAERSIAPPVMTAPGSHPTSMGAPFGPVPGPSGAGVPASPAGLLGPSSPAGLAPFQAAPPAAPGKEKDRSFWMVVDAELIVYGATEPDASVTLQGMPIRLRPDGTFSARFALPDGRQEIPVSATSADEVDTFVITPIVERWTTAESRD